MGIRISEQTIEILNNFSTICPGFLHDPTVAEGQLRVASPNGNLVAFAKVPEQFPEFSIFDMKAFISFMNMMKDGEVEFFEKNMKVTRGKSKGIFTFCSKLVVLTPPKKVNMPEMEVEILLSASVIKQILKASTVLAVTELVISCPGNGEAISISSEGKKDSGIDNNFQIELDETHDTKFRFVMPAEIIRFIPADYKVELSSRNVARFSANLSSNGEYAISYFVSLDATSTYGK
jgi:hypothetical protein